MERSLSRLGERMDSKKVVAASGGLTAGLILWMLTTITANQNDTLKALSDIRERLARIESRIDFHHGKPTPPEVEVAKEAAAAAELTEPRR